MSLNYVFYILLRQNQAPIRSCLELLVLYRDLEKNQPGRGGDGGTDGRFCNIVADLPNDKTDPARDHFTYPTSVRVGFRVRLAWGYRARLP